MTAHAAEFFLMNDMDQLRILQDAIDRCLTTRLAVSRLEISTDTAAGCQDRLVKELRLRGISTPEAANAFADEFMADYNRRFAKPPRHDFDIVHKIKTHFLQVIFRHNMRGQNQIIFSN